MKRRLFIATAMFTLLTSNANAADNLKVGIVDMNVVLQKAPLMVTLNADLIKNFKPRQDEINTAQKQLQDETDQMNINGATLSNDARNKIQDKIITDKANVDMLTASLQRDLTIAKNQALQTFMNKLSVVINKIAEAEHYDLIEQRTNTIYVNKALDLTDKVVTQIK